MAYATCHTSGCENDGIPIDVGDLVDPISGEATGVMCGPCGRMIDDVSDEAPAAPQETHTEGTSA